MPNKSIKIYNIIFPIWLLVLFPPFLLIAMPLNFMIDLAVIVLAMKYLKIADIKQNAKQIILKVWLLGFAADFIGGAFMLLPNFLEMLLPAYHDWIYQNLIRAVMFDPFGSLWGFLYIMICILLAGLAIYLFNLKISLKKLAIPLPQKKKIALTLAIFTAPYLFLLPYDLFA